MLQLPARRAQDRLRDMSPIPGDIDRMPRLAGSRILLVEDEALIAMEIEMAIEDCEAQVVGPAASVDQGLELVDTVGKEIDVAILDVDLHGLEVFPVASRLKELGVPFLFHTGHGRQRELNALFDDAPVCSKPTRMEKLLQTAGDLID